MLCLAAVGGGGVMIKSSEQSALQQDYFILSAILMTLLPIVGLRQNQRVWYQQTALDANQ